MALKTVVQAITEVPESDRAHYALREGKYVLQIEGDELPGFVPAAKHAQFRDTNIKFLKALGTDSVDEAMRRLAIVSGIDPAKLERLKAIDPEEYATLRAKVEEFEKRGVRQPGDVEAAIAGALEKFKSSVVQPLQDKLSASEKRENEQRQRLADSTIREAVASRFTKAGGRADAGVLDFILTRAREAFRVVDDKVVATEGHFGAKGDPLTVDEWIAQATKEHPFAFEPSRGSGANPSGGRMVQPTNGTFRTSGGAELKSDGIAVL